MSTTTNTPNTTTTTTTTLLHHLTPIDIASKTAILSIERTTSKSSKIIKTPIEVPPEAKDVLSTQECVRGENIKDIPESSENDKTFPLIDIFINPNKRSNKIQLAQKLQRRAKDYFESSNMTDLYPNLFEILWYASLPCTHLAGLDNEFMIKSCEIGGIKFDCSELFTKIPTDLGMCCSLNTRNALKKSIYTTLLKKMQNSSDFSDRMHNAKQRVSAKVGVQNGLKLVLDLHSNTESFGTVANDFNAFKIFMGQSTEFPTLKDRSLLVQPGMEHYLDISSEIFSSRAIQNLKPVDRNCYFHDEGNLDFYNYYTVSNCKFECGLKLSESSIGCIPWYLPHGVDSKTWNHP